MLLTSFILLALSGFALKFPDSWLSWALGSDETLRRWLHRIAGVVLLGLGGYHLVYILVTREGRRLLRDFWPRMRDLKDVRTNVRFLTGRSPVKARFGRFGYVEKMEYWAVVWGTIIMGVTGLMIWLKMDVTQYLPRWIIDVATTIHYYEAILACLAIVVWHFYHIFLAPGAFPMNWAWWDGKMPKEHYREEHPLDLESVTSDLILQDPADSQSPPAMEPAEPSRRAVQPKSPAPSTNGHVVKANGAPDTWEV
jgi:cytochrome b subunit of formate dehydrogenase